MSPLPNPSREFRLRRPEPTNGSDIVLVRYSLLTDCKLDRTGEGSAQYFMFKLIQGFAHLDQHELVGSILIDIRDIPIKYCTIFFDQFSHVSDDLIAVSFQFLFFNFCHLVDVVIQSDIGDLFKVFADSLSCSKRLRSRSRRQQLLR